MHTIVRESWSPRSSDYSSPSTSMPASEAQFSCDADDELTHSEGMASGNRMDATSSEIQGQRTGSPAPSETGSVYSYSSSSHQLTRDVYGRRFNNVNDFYVLPVDVDEHGRLDLQHEILKQVMDGIFVNANAAKHAMTARNGTKPAALDIGTGSGSWVVDCARLFPDAEVVGLDLAPANPTMEPPSNARFECDDANFGMTHYRNSFDVVNARCCCSGFESYRRFLDDVLQVLRPGGVYQTIEGSLRYYDENRRLIPPQQDGDPNISWTVKIAHAAREAIRARGDGVDAYNHIPSWLEEMGSVWEEVGAKDFWTAIGPWPQNDEKARMIGEMSRQNVLSIVDSFRPLLLSYGYFDETVDKWTAKVREELRELKRPLYIRWHCAWAVKRRSSNQD